MTAFVALLRAVNVGGTGTLKMSDLKRLCEDVGLRAVRTYIASGNVVFDSSLDEAEVQRGLEETLQRFAGKPLGVLVRTAAQIADVLAHNPFPEAAPNRTVAVFLNHPPTPDTLAAISGQQGEELRLGAREIYIHYGDGMARSKLRLPAADQGTARNMNTIAKLAAMAAERA